MTGNPNYKRGYQLENRMKHKLEAEGYFVSRSAGSHGVDLIAIKNPPNYPFPTILFVSCKVAQYIPPTERAEFIALAHKYGAKPMITRRDSQRRWILEHLD